MSNNLTGPMELMDAELDAVAAGALINVGNVASNDTIQIGIPVNANAAVAVLGTAVAQSGQTSSVTF